VSLKFELVSDYEPEGDQPKAIDQLHKGVLSGKKHQVLLGVTGSGKTFTIAHLISRLNRPTLIIAHNKILAAQLYGALKLPVMTLIPLAVLIPLSTPMS